MQEAVNAAELKRIIEGLPLETSAVAAVEWRLGQLEPSQFAALLTELARDNHAFRYFAAKTTSPSPPSILANGACCCNNECATHSSDAIICFLPLPLLFGGYWPSER